MRKEIRRPKLVNTSWSGRSSRINNGRSLLTFSIRTSKAGRIQFVRSDSLFLIQIVSILKSGILPGSNLLGISCEGEYAQVKVNDRARLFGDLYCASSRAAAGTDGGPGQA